MYRKHILTISLVPIIFISSTVLAQQLNAKQRAIYNQHQKLVASLKSLNTNDQDYTSKLNQIYKDIDTQFVNFEVLSSNRIPQEKADMALDYEMLEPLIKAAQNKDSCDLAIYENNTNRNLSKPLYEFIAKTLVAICKK